MLHKPQRQPFCHLICAILLLTCGLVLFRVGLINYTNHISNKVITFPLKAHNVLLFLFSFFTTSYTLFRVLHGIRLLRAVPIIWTKKDGILISTEKLYFSFLKTNLSILCTTVIGSDPVRRTRKKNPLFHYLGNLKKTNLAIVFSGDFR